MFLADRPVPKAKVRMMRSAFRTFVLNADDFAMDEGIDAAILDLAGRGIVTSASALVLSPRWSKDGRELSQASISKGLHLDFTSPFANPGFPECSIGALVTRAYGGLLNRESVRGSIRHQLSLYEDVMREIPQFIDGHRHVHQLPVIREELIAGLQERYGGRLHPVKLRSCRPKAWRGLEAALVGATGSRALERLARVAGQAVNTDFAGVYSFSGQARLERLWRRWLASPQGPSPLIMCHPANGRGGGAAVHDLIREARLREYAWLAGSAFRELCLELRMAPALWA